MRQPSLSGHELESMSSAGSMSQFGRRLEVRQTKWEGRMPTQPAMITWRASDGGQRMQQGRGDPGSAGVASKWWAVQPPSSPFRLTPPKH